MTIRKGLELLCDGCAASVIAPCSDEMEARAWARERSWRMRDDVDYCPVCAAPGERAEVERLREENKALRRELSKAQTDARIYRARCYPTGADAVAADVTVEPARADASPDVRVTVAGDTAVISGPRSWKGEPMTAEHIRRLELISEEFDELLCCLGVEFVDESGSKTALEGIRRIVARKEAAVARRIADALEIPPLAEDYEAAMRAVRMVADNLKAERGQRDGD